MQNVQISIRQKLIKLVLIMIVTLVSQLGYTDPMSRGDNGATSPETEEAADTAALNKESPILNVPLPNGNSSYYLNPESVGNSIKAPINTINKIVAYVNKGVITSNQVNVQIVETLQSFKQKGITPPSIEDVRNRVIDQLIMQKIQLDLAARTGIKTSDLEVTEAINNIASQNKMTSEQFKPFLAKQGINFDDFRKQIQNQITTDKLKQREVDGRVTINDDEVNLILNSEAYKNRVDYNLSDIIVGIPEQGNAEVVAQKEAMATKAYNELKSGVPFYQVSAKYSNSPNALTGGELGWRTNAALPPQIISALNNLNPGDYTNVIHLPVGFFIFKVNEIKKHGLPQILRQYHVRHILIKVNEVTGDDEAHQKIQGIRNILERDAGNPTVQNADFIRLAKQYSEDTSSINGGDIGWVSKGDTVPPFEQVMLATPVGVISQPVHTAFGWHILEVLAIRDSNLTNDKEKAEIRQEIHENKATMMYQQWLRDIRDSAYVKINDN